VVNVPQLLCLEAGEQKDSRIPPLNEVKEEVTERSLGESRGESPSSGWRSAQSNSNRQKYQRGGKRERLSIGRDRFFHPTAGLFQIGPAREFMGILASLTEKILFPKRSFGQRMDILWSGYPELNLQIRINSNRSRKIWKND